MRCIGMSRICPPVVLLLATFAQAHANEQAVLLCAQPQVLSLVAERLGRAGMVQSIEAGPVGQVPGGQPDLVNCAVRVRAVAFDTTRFGRAPVETLSVYSYTLRLGRNGVFMQPDP